MENRISREDVEKLNKKVLVELLLSMQGNFEDVKRQNERLEVQLADLNKNFSILLEKFNLAQSNRFGRSSEKIEYTQQEYEQMNLLTLYGTCFNEAEHTVENTVAVEPEIIDVCAHKKKKTVGKRKNDLSNIPHAEPISSELTHEELLELLGEGYKRMPDDVYSHLEFHPGSFEVQEYHVAVYKSADGERFAHAKRPTADLLKNSIASPSLVAAIFNYKYVNALPIYRLQQEFSRCDINLSRQVMCNWVIRTSERYLSLVFDRMKLVLLKQDVIQADETTVEVSKDGRKAGSKSYMWVYSTGELDNSGKRVVLYDYQKTRSTEHLRRFLKDYAGILISDGYQSYHTLEKEKENLIVSGCYAHARRRFSNAIKAMPKDMDEAEVKKSLAYSALKQLATIYKIEESLKELSAEERLERRCLSVKPLVEAFFEWIRTNQNKVPAKSETGEGFSYCLNQEKYLKIFLTNGNVPIDNSSSERNIRPFCVGRKNWMMIDTIAGAQASAIAYSIAETAKANNLKPYDYFKYLLTEIPKHQEETSLEIYDEFLPWSDSLPEHIRKKTK